MTVIYAAATVPINPPGATPLSLDQIWAALEVKRSQPQLFLKVIDTCKALEDDGESILREVKFKDGGGVGTPLVLGVKVQERITHIKPVTCSQFGLETFDAIGSATRVLNIVSTGLDGELYLTLTFEWDHPEIEKASQEEIEKQSQFQGSAPKAVASMLVEVRKMVE